VDEAPWEWSAPFFPASFVEDAFDMNASWVNSTTASAMVAQAMVASPPADTDEKVGGACRTVLVTAPLLAAAALA
jgi:hypothetical protein